jgi:NADH-quinone oxidoreductase subunit D
MSGSRDVSAHERLRVLVGSLAPGVLPVIAEELPAGTILIDLGPDHPSQAGLIELRLWTAEGVISSAQVVVGAMHRGVEKLFEVRDYTQILMLADRHDWHAPFSGELAVARACEQMMGLAVPERAVWLRTLLAEHTRILSHAGFLTWVARVSIADPGLNRLRESLRTQTLALTGNRIHPMVNRIGGLAADADPDWLRTETRLMVDAEAAAEDVLALVDASPVAAVTEGVAVLDVETIAQYGVSGPTARASGVDLDLRRQLPYLAYADLADLIGSPTTADGDAHARLRALAEEMIASARLVRACADRLATIPGPVAVRLGKIIRLPEGQAYAAVEAPLGIAGVYLSSRGEKTPWRLKLRTPSFNNIASLETLLVGVAPAALEATLASVGYVVGDIDK